MQTRKRWISAAAMAASLLALAQPAPGQQLTLERIFSSADFRVRGAGGAAWLPDGDRFALIEERGDGRTDLVAVHARTGERTVLIEGARLVPPGGSAPIEIESYSWSADGSRVLIYTNSQRVWRSNTKGTYYVWEVGSGTLRPLSSAPGWQQFAKFSPDGSRVGFVRENDIFVVELPSYRETRLTHDGSEDVINGTFDWVYEEELGLQDGWRWSPDGRRIAFWRLDQSDVRTFYMISDTSLYARPVPLRYPKAGEANSIVTIGVIDAGGGPVTWIDLGEDTDIYPARMDWADNPRELLVQRMNRHQNRIDLLLADASTGSTRLLFSETDPAWVDVRDELTWVNGGRQFLWTSERDGFHHIYLFDRSGRLVRQLTRGEWEVLGIQGVDERNGWVYFTAARPSPRERQLYRVRLNGRNLERVTREPGAYSVQVSPTGSYFIATHSRAGVPPTTRLHAADGTPIRELASNEQLAQRIGGMGLRQPEFFAFTTSDGVELDGWMIRPADFDPSRRYPVLMYVYGGPGSQTVTDSWWGNRYLWHQLLAQKGYIVVSVDNRGTGNRGREFRKMTYLNLGRWETNDQIEAARHLASLPYVDASRIGIWGWSYGGYMAAMAVTQEEHPFRAAISVAPVADWRLYDNIYTERFMRTPAENPQGYDAGSPIRNAANLEGNFLLIHGTADDNVHFQNAVQLAAALQAANKQFDFMLYPERNHSISGGPTQLHLHTLMTRWLEENL